MIADLTVTILSIFATYIPLSLSGTTPTVEPVKTKKFEFNLILSFFILFKTNLKEFSGLIYTVLVFPFTIFPVFTFLILHFRLPIFNLLNFFFGPT